MKLSNTKLFAVSTLMCLSLVQNGFGQCDVAEHSTNWEDAWVSCSVSESPNPDRGDVHWIIYDMGDVYSLESSQIWNFNVGGQTNLGVRNVYFDISLNGTDWAEFGNEEIAEAPGTDDYIGIPGPDFGGIAARYLLLSVQSNWGGDDCAGFAEIRVNREYLGVGIDENSNDITMTLYPNPTSEVLTIKHYQNKSLSMQVLNGSGQIILQERLSGTTKSLNVSGWAAGLYMLILQDEHGHKGTERFVVSH